jgi:glutathione synthase/RimK-type ligase-like ATP-grasp enzyme
VSNKKDILILKGDRPNDVITDSYLSWKSLQRLGSDRYFLEQYSDIIFTILDGEVSCISAVSGRDLASYDLVYIRGITHEEIRNSIALYLQKRQKKFINSELKQTQYTSKLLQYVAMAQAGVAVPDTVYANFRHRAKAFELLSTSYPVVAKSTTGSNGNDNFLIKSKKELLEVGADINLVIQPFIPNSFDYRVVVASDKILIAYKRTRGESGDYRNNVSQGGERSLVKELPKDVEDMVKRASSTLGRDLSGVDVIQDSDTKKLYVLEVNFNYGTPILDDEVMDEYFLKLAQYLHDSATSAS